MKTAIARSFDFPQEIDGKQYGRDVSGPDANYIEGTLEGIEPHPHGYDAYVIKITKIVFNGTEFYDRIGQIITPPINGTSQTFGGVTNGVDLI